MTIQPISAAAAALYFTPADLREHGLPPDELTDEQILQLTQQALKQAELPLEEPLEIESYPDRCGLLVFVRTTAPVETVWCFENLEHLLAAAHTLGSDAPHGSLYQWDDRYWLVCEGECPLLSEFAACERGDPYIHARLTEYGTRLLTADAPAVLRRHFQ